MDFGGNKSRSKRRRNANKENIPGGYNQDLQFYKIPPTETISLFEFEDYAVERLRGRHVLTSEFDSYLVSTLLELACAILLFLFQKEDLLTVRFTHSVSPVTIPILNPILILILYSYCSILK